MFQLLSTSLAGFAAGFAAKLFFGKKQKIFKMENRMEKIHSSSLTLNQEIALPQKANTPTA